MTDRDTIRAMAEHLTQLAQLLTEYVMEGGPVSGVPVVSGPQTLPPYAAVIAQPQSGPWTCPVHGSSKYVPAGVSHRNCDDSHNACKSYEGFTACPERGCSEKPRQARPQAPERAYAPSQPRQLP